MTSRSIPAATRSALEGDGAAIALLAFLTVSHPALVTPLRVVSDPVDFVKDGHTFIGMPFRFRPLNDDEQAGRAELTISNVDREIARAIDGLDARPIVDLEICSSADFDLAADPREPLGAVTPIYALTSFEIVSVTLDVSEVRATVALRDISRLPWPFTRATETRCPGLFR